MGKLIGHGLLFFMLLLGLTGCGAARPNQPVSVEAVPQATAAPIATPTVQPSGQPSPQPISVRGWLLTNESGPIAIYNVLEEDDLFGESDSGTRVEITYEVGQLYQLRAIRLTDGVWSTTSELLLMGPADGGREIILTFP